MPKPYRIDQNSEFKEENGGFSDGTLKQVANHKAVSSLRIAKAIFIGDAAVGKTSLGLFSILAVVRGTDPQINSSSGIQIFKWPAFGPHLARSVDP